MRQRHQPGPGIACLGRLEAGQSPGQGLFAEAPTGFNRPAISVSCPNCLGSDHNSIGRVEGRQPGDPDGFRRFVLLPMRLCADRIAQGIEPAIHCAGRLIDRLQVF